MIENQNYIIIDLIGSLPDERESTLKIDGYYQPANGFLIRDFAHNFFSLPPKNVKIFAYGCEKDYYIYIHTNNKCYYQIDLNNFFQIDISSSKIVFDYFTNFDDALSRIDKEISDNPNKKIILFLDDHRFKGYFSRIVYFRLYEIIMKYPNNYFLILNDSCFSGSFIDLIHAYNYVYELKKSNEKDDIDLQLLFSFNNIFRCDSANLNSIRSIDEVVHLIDFFQNIEMPNDDTFNMIIQFNIPKDIDPNDPIEKILNDTKDQIIQKVFHKVQDILDFKMIVSCYEKLQSQNKDESTQSQQTPEPLFVNYKNIFNKTNLKLFIALSNSDLKGFIQKLDVLYIARNEINFSLTPHKNIEVITSTDNEHKCLSFASIRVNDVIKVYPGSPAMGSFIKEVFMKNDKSSVNFNNIEKEMTQIDGKTLYFPMRVKQEFKAKRKKLWTHLYPEHYKETDINFSLSYTNETLEKIAALRTISFLNITKLTEAANLLTQENSKFNPRSINDPCADIVAIIALLSKYKRDPITIINECITTNKVIWDHNPHGIESVSLMIKLSFQLSKRPLQMIAITVNILEEACKKAIYDKLVLINNNEESEDIPNFLFTKDEISKLLKHLNKIQENCSNDENKVSKFYSSLDNKILMKSIFDIEQAIISLLGPSPIFFSTFIASYCLKEKNLAAFTKLASEYLSSSPDKSFLHFLNSDFIKAKENETEDILNERNKNNKEIAEYYLLAHVNKSLMCVNSCCGAQVKCDAMKIVANQFCVIDTLSIIFILIDVFNENDDNKLFIKDIINQIEILISKTNISIFFIPTIISFLPKKTVFYALYSSLSYLQNGWYEELMKKLEMIKNIEEYKMNYDDILMITKKSLTNKIEIKNKTIYLEEIKKMKDYTSIKIQNSIDKVQKLVDVSVHKSRNNISKKMNLSIIKDQINEYFNNLPLKFEKNKFFEYLTSSIFELSNTKNNYIDLLILNSNIQKEKFIVNEKLILDTKNIFERASNELRTVAYLFNISDIPITESDEFNDKQAIQFPVGAMSARVFNIVEMAPIIEKINGNYDRFDPSDGANPNIKELMGLHSGIMHILSPKDEERKRYKTELMKNQVFDTDIEINVFETDETDSYYSSDYFDNTNSVSFRSIEFDGDNEITLIKKPNSLFKQPSIEKYQKLQMSKLKISFIREELELGQCDWEGDVWKAFVYCFNLKLEKIGIQYDPNDDYKEITYPYCITDGIDIVLKFFPLTSVLVFWHNRAQIERFVGKNRIHAKEIIKSFIQSFDDVDRIVTPLYTSNETYQIRTPDLFKLIFDF